jgi:FKBP-type peptidyl-prolyl cis-trans isomerase 2
MILTSPDSLADLLITFTWEKHGIRHKDIYFADEANFYRDYFPAGLDKDLMGKFQGETITRTFKPGELIPDYSDREVHRIPIRQLDLRRLQGLNAQALKGRYYPKGIINGFAGIFSGNIVPFRVIGCEPDCITADFNHPLAGIPLHMTIEIIDIRTKTKERDRKSTRLNSSHNSESRMPSSA